MGMIAQAMRVSYGEWSGPRLPSYSASGASGESVGHGMGFMRTCGWPPSPNACV